MYDTAYIICKLVGRELAEFTNFQQPRSNENYRLDRKYTPFETTLVLVLLVPQYLIKCLEKLVPTKTVYNT